jgi:microcystin-dependent protein
LPYNGSGNFALPSNSWNPAVANTAITADDWNAVANDLALGLTTAMTRDGQSATTARIPFALGLSATGTTVSSPAYAATGDLNTGVYFPAADQIGLTAGGVSVLTATSSALTIALAATFSGAVTFSGNQTVTGNLTVNGNTTIGNAVGDTLTVAATSTFTGPVTVPDASFANAKLANMATQTIKGRTTAGTGVPEDLSATQATAILNPVTGDSGSGGVKGLVPAPAAGDAAAARFLSAAGIWEAAVPVGSITMHGANAAPSGWLECDGAAVSRATYAGLFAAIGTVFGVGDGTTTFNVPDLRGEFVRGWDDGRAVDPARAFGSAQSDEFKAHVHSVQPPASNDDSASGLTSTGTGGAEIITPYNTASTGGSETRPRNIALLFIIKF